MASPTIESLCCLTTNNEFSRGFLVDFHTIPYNLVSILSSLLGIAGALFQIFRKEDTNPRVHRSSTNKFLRTRGRVIIKWLAMADLMAATGILIRSISWLSDKTFGASETDSALGQIFCVITSGWIHYFYTATYLWTFIYALDVTLVLQERKVDHRLYHFFGWSVPAATCLVGLLFLYLPDLNCYNSTVNPYLRFLPNYLSTFVPILAVMVANPILYVVSFSSIEKLLASTTGRFTQRERHVVRSLKIKFLLITSVFCLCWTPNVLNGIVLWASWAELPKTAVIVIWYLMAVLNPLQAVLNCFVYRSWDSAVAWRRPFWLHPRLWGDQDASSFSSSSSSSSQRRAEVDGGSGATEDPKKASIRYNPFQDMNPWQRISTFHHASSSSSNSSTKTGENTPLLSSSLKMSVTAGEEPESDE